MSIEKPASFYTRICLELDLRDTVEDSMYSWGSQCKGIFNRLGFGNLLERISPELLALIYDELIQRSLGSCRQEDIARMAT